MSFQISSREFATRTIANCFRRFPSASVALAALALAAGIFPGMCGLAVGQQPNVHALIDSNAAPGVTGRKLLRSGRIKPATYQPVQIVAPESAIVSTASGGGFSQETFRPTLGLLVGRAYRFRVSYVTKVKEHVVYPTVELIDNLDPPEGRAQEFPVPVEFTAEEIEMAASGNMVTRVVYVEDPKLSLPALYRRGAKQPWFETEPGTDPLAVADTLGRPIAIVRIGSREPDSTGPTSAFLFESPPIVRYSGGVPLAAMEKMPRIPREEIAQQEFAQLEVAKEELPTEASLIKSYEFEMGDVAPVVPQASPDNSKPFEFVTTDENLAPIQNLAPVQELAPVQKLAPVESFAPIGSFAPVKELPPVKNAAPVQLPKPIKTTPSRNAGWNRPKARRASWKK